MTKLLTPEDFDRLMDNNETSEKIVRGAIRALTPILDDPYGLPILVCALGMLARYNYRTPEEFSSILIAITILLADAPLELAETLDHARNNGEPKH